MVVGTRNSLPLSLRILIHTSIPRLRNTHTRLLQENRILGRLLYVHVQKDRPDDHIRRYVPSSETQVREKRKKKTPQNKKDKADVPRHVYIYTYLGTSLRYGKVHKTSNTFRLLIKREEREGKGLPKVVLYRITGTD